MDRESSVLLMLSSSLVLIDAIFAYSDYENLIQCSGLGSKYIVIVVRVRNICI